MGWTAWISSSGRIPETETGPLKPRLIPPVFVPRVWGTRDLAPFYPQAAEPVGEVWFQLDKQFPLLVKFLFTEENLSVQVHPPDDYALQHHGSRGKTEMWHILDARPGAQIAVGFRQPLTRRQAEEAIRSGEIERLLNWFPVSAGETYYTPAGIVHAIGAGIRLCEIQQNSDITYRLYDYGRGRELHLEHGLAVADLGWFDPRRQLPLECPYFSTQRIETSQALSLRPSPSDAVCIILHGQGRLEGQTIRSGEAWLLPAGVAVSLQPEGQLKALLTAKPAGL